MSNKEKIKNKLNKRRQVDKEIIALLLQNPHCLDGDSEKANVYQIAIDFFVAMENECESQEKNSAKADAIKLAMLLEEYGEAREEAKNNCAIKIAYFMLERTTYCIKQIPEELRDVAFDIIMLYLEIQCS